MKITYYLEVLSSWCFWAEPTWAELKQRYAGRVQFDWKIALMRQEDFPSSAAQCDWFYRRSGMIVRSPFMLNSGWYETPTFDYSTPDRVAEAARSLGVTDDTARLALSHACEREGRKIGRIEEAVAVVVAATKLDGAKLRAAAESAAVRDRVAETTKEFFAHQVDQRPTFILEDAIGDKAVFSGLVRIEPLAATIEAMLADEAAYAAHKAHFGGPPAS